MTYAAITICIALGVAIGYVAGHRSSRRLERHFSLVDTAIGQHGRALRRVEDRLKALERVR